MSGPICPDCGSFNVLPLKKDNDKCNFCGWEGEKLPRKILSTDMYDEYVQEQRQKKKAREDGELFFLRVFVKAERYQDPVEDELFMMLDADCAQCSWQKPWYIYMELNSKPTKAEKDKIKKLKGVTDIKVK